MANAFFWVIVAVVLIIALSSTLKEVRRGARRRVAVADQKAGATPPARGTGGDLDQVEALARSGRYTEAVHLLLQRAVDRIGRRRRLDRSLTSREILASEEGPGGEPLSILVEAVERSWFGGLALDRAGYEHCLSASRRLAKAFGDET